MPKRILIINTGGTLSSVKSSKGLVPGMSSGDMLEELRMVSKNLELETEDFCSLDSSNIGPEDWTGLATLIARRSYDYHGIVVIHGTDTLAYTSAMLSFMLAEYFDSGSCDRKPAFYRQSGCRCAGKLSVWNPYGSQRISGSFCCIQP